MLTDQELSELKPYISGLVEEYVTQLLSEPVSVPGLTVGQAVLTDSGLTLANLADLRDLAAAPAAPESGYHRLFSKADGLHMLTPAGADLLLPFICLAAPLTSTAYDGNDTIAVGTYTIDTSAWGAPAGIKAALVMLSGQWTTAEASNYAALRPAGGATNAAVLRSHANGLGETQTILVPCNGNGDFDLVVAGASLELAVIRIWGYFG